MEWHQLTCPLFKSRVQRVHVAPLAKLDYAFQGSRPAAVNKKTSVSVLDPQTGSCIAICFHHLESRVPKVRSLLLIILSAPTFTLHWVTISNSSPLYTQNLWHSRWQLYSSSTPLNPWPFPASFGFYANEHWFCHLESLQRRLLLRLCPLVPCRGLKSSPCCTNTTQVTHVCSERDTGVWGLSGLHTPEISHSSVWKVTEAAPISWFKTLWVPTELRHFSNKAVWTRTRNLHSRIPFARVA